ncbi:hypothetical protein [Rufibacter latericius]|uniref:Uncharacterized protein n=1 Tax=Rufibacter latericius TaxID=2487040 RepID=A0A3M9M8W8_9BACT|nr:hypothetical protein [Rufibacter latericius]RNI22009.1 hypothetical protein EFB08_23030 [Rufibacter latericius]
MKFILYKKLNSGVLLLVFPFMVGCSILPGGGGYSSDPLVSEQERRVESLKAEVKRAEADTEAAEEREKAAKSRLKAAQDELKVFKTEAKRRGA